MSWRETEDTLESERQVSEIVSELWDCEMVKTEVGCPYDYKALRGKLVSLVEVRKRSVNSDKYDKLFMGKTKWSKLCLLGSIYEVPVMFIVVFDDEIKWIDLTMHPRLETTYASRGSIPAGGERATDKEQAILIPVSYMRTLKVLETV